MSIGILTVTSALPKDIKDNSSYKVNFSLYPFDFQFKNNKYIISAGNTVNAAMNGLNCVKTSVSDFIDQFTTPVK
jgi:hypothetical protein